ncbi:MAG: hypothetical protein FD126_3419, partial [Elusimicrobia bacterium]
MSTPIRALLAFLLMPSSAFAQGGRVVTAPVGEAGIGVGGGYAGVRSPSVAPVTNFMNPVFSVVTQNQPAFQTLTPTVSNPNVAAAMADPRTQTAMPASAFVAPNGSVQAASPDAAAKTASPRQEPGAIPSFDDPSRRTPEGGSASGASTAVKELDKAKKDEADGKNPGALGVKLDSMFDFAKARSGSVANDPSAAAAAQLGAPSVAGLPDPKVMGVEPALV